MPYLDFLLLAQEGGNSFESLFRILPPFIIIGLLLYFMMIRPEKRQRDKLREQQSTLKKNDRVVIAGGIYGIVGDAPKDGDRVKVRVDENNNTTLRVMRNSILQVLDDDAKATSKKDAGASS
jgi:preprotein translocase subunit YajC